MVFRSLARALAPGFVLVFLLAGCNQLPNVALPTRPTASAPPASPSTVTTVGGTGSEQVIAAYVSYWQAYGAAMRTRNIAAARRLLANVTDADFLRQVTAPMPRVWAAHEIGYGYAIPHVLGVIRRSTSASLHDCLDLSHFGVQDTRTGLIVPGSFGLPELNFYVTLTRSAGRWVVSNMQQVEVPCTP